MCFYKSKKYLNDHSLDYISRKTEDFTGVSGITTECNNPKSASEITELTFGWQK